MTMHDQRFDRALPNLFVELASASTPDYLEAAIERASSRPQRPAWTYPGRWLPVDITTQAAPAARMPWRQLGILALIGLLLAVAAVAYVGTRRGPSPAPPFGLAANGAIAMERGGDIVTVDHVTGTVTEVTTGPEVDRAPVFFRDGTRIAFERHVDGPVDQALIMVAHADGTGLVQATAEPLAGLQLWTLSPDGRDLLVTTNARGAWKLTMLAVDGSREPTPVDISQPGNLDELEPASYRPPDGREILVVAQPAGSPTRGIFVVDAATGKTLRTIVEPSPEFDVFGASWSPTGDAISYGRFAVVGEGPRALQHVVAADGTGDRQMDAGAGNAYNAAASPWSNDGTRLVVLRDDGTAGQALIVPMTGNAPAVEITCGPPGVAGCPDNVTSVTWIWSPDDTVLVGSLTAEDGSTTYYFADPETGRMTPTEWPGTGEPDWQRTAP